MKLFIIWFVIYIGLSVASQMYASVPIELGVLAGVAIWMPISAMTLVPFVDVTRSFTQHVGEQAGLQFKHVGTAMLVCTFLVSGLCVLFAGLPLPIFIGVLLAVTIGGAVDILVFQRMGKWFKHPVARMAFSNLMATLVGGFIVFFVAFTDIIFPENPLAKTYFEAMVGWLSQSVFIYFAGLAMGYLTSKLLKVSNA